MKQNNKITAAIVIGLVSCSISASLLLAAPALADDGTADAIDNSQLVAEELITPVQILETDKAMETSQQVTQKLSLKEKMAQRIHMAFHRQATAGAVSDGHHIKRLEGDTGQFQAASLNGNYRAL